MLLLLTACVQMGDHLAALREKKPSGDTFPQALAAEYLAYSESLAEEGHPLRANYFAGKGLAALESGDADLEDKPALAESRQALVSVLTPDIKEIAPAKAARAQLLFDCWAEKEGVCKNSFATALADLQFIADALVHGENNHFVAHFEPGSAVLTGEISAIVDVVARRVASLGEYNVEMTAPSKKSALSGKRLLVLEKALIARGVNAGRLHVHRSAGSREVMLSIDRDNMDANSVAISIQTYGQPEEAITP